MNTPNNQDLKRNVRTKIQKTNYLELLAASLISYANTNKEFALYLQSVSAGIESEGHDSTSLLNDSEVIVPESSFIAHRRSDWLVDHIEKQSLPGATAAGRVLAGWAISNQAPEPKSVVLGIKVGVMPIGIMGHMKLQERMPVILRSDYTDNDTLKTSEWITKASVTALNHAIERAGGSAHKLEPEMGDWFYGEKALQLFRTEQDSFDRIREELATKHIFHGVVHDESGIVALAMSPAVNSKYPELQWKLTPVE